jgi:hypothetical protein
MPIDPNKQMQLAAIVSTEKGKAFQKLAKRHYRSVSAELNILIDKAIEEDKKK